MRGFDIWNHPMVIKACRVKYRGGTLPMQAGGVLLLLLFGLMLMHRFQADLGGLLWMRNYFIGMISLQLLISAILAAAGTASSMTAEVSKHTLDFQRIAGLSPMQILLGKAFGEPVPAYLFSVVTIPIAVICCVFGGVNLLVAALLYLTLLTSTFMMACIGLQHSLEPAKKPGSGSQGGIWTVVVMVFFWISAMSTRGVGTTPIGLLTPIPTIQAMMMSNTPSGLAAWSIGLPFFGLTVPFILLTPLMQIAVAVLALSAMARRLKHSLDTTISKPMSYGVLAIIEILLLGSFFDTIQAGINPTAYAVGFAAAHAVVVLLFAGLSTPGRESYQSWIWRFRGRRHPAIDLLVGERSLNVVTLVVAWCLGVLIFGVSVAVAMGQLPLLPQVHWPALVIAFTLSLVLVLFYGLFYQVVCIATGMKGAGAIPFFAAVIFMAAPFIAGEYWELPILSSLSPVATFIRLAEEPLNYYSPGPILAVHGAGILFWCWGLHGISRRLTRQIDRKLATMGIPQAAQPAFETDDQLATGTV